jgi:pilus assembly protein CpaF
VLARLASCALQSGVELPYQAIRQQIADAIQFVLHLSRTDSRRYVQELIRVGRYDGARDGYEPETVFKHEDPQSGPEAVYGTVTREDETAAPRQREWRRGLDPFGITRRTSPDDSGSARQ